MRRAEHSEENHVAVKGSQFLHLAGGYVVDRIQTGGVTNLNQAEEKIYELGNKETVATIRDTPDLSFEVESLDPGVEFEARLVGIDDHEALPDGYEIDFADYKQLDIISPFRDQAGFSAIRGIIVPFLTIESCTYRAGVRANFTQNFTLRGDSQYFGTAGPPYMETFSGNGATTVFSLARTASLYEEKGEDIYVLSIQVRKADGSVQRLFFGEHYTNTNNGFTLASAALAPAGSTIVVTYFSATPANYLQSVHEGVDIKPAALRHRNVDIYISDGAATPTMERWNGVQTFEVTRRVNLENDEELGNVHFVEQSYDTAEVTGSIVLKPPNVTDMFEKIRKIANVPAGQVVGPFTTQNLPLEARLEDDDGTRWKTLYVSDARFSMPNVQGRANQKLDNITLNFSSDGGNFSVFKGTRA